MEYNFFIETELRDLDKEKRLVEHHSHWIEVAEENRDKNINWHIYWNRYHHNEEHYTPDEIIKILEEIK